MVRQDSRRSCWTSPEELFLDWQQFECPIPPSFGGVGLLVESIKNPKSPPGQTPPEAGHLVFSVAQRFGVRYETTC